MLTNLSDTERAQLARGTRVACLLQRGHEHGWDKVWIYAGTVREVSRDGSLVVIDTNDGTDSFVSSDWLAVFVDGADGSTAHAELQREMHYADADERRREIADCCGPEDARTVPFDTGVVHGPKHRLETESGAFIESPHRLRSAHPTIYSSWARPWSR